MLLVHLGEDSCNEQIQVDLTGFEVLNQASIIRKKLVCSKGKGYCFVIVSLSNALFNEIG